MTVIFPTYFTKSINTGTYTSIFWLFSCLLLTRTCFEPDATAVSCFGDPIKHLKETLINHFPFICKFFLSLRSMSVLVNTKVSTCSLKLWSQVKVSLSSPVEHKAAPTTRAPDPPHHQWAMPTCCFHNSDGHQWQSSFKLLLLLCKKINICLGGQRIFVEPQKDPSCIPNHGWQTSQMFSNLPIELLEAVPASLPILLPCSQHRPCFYPKLNFHLQHSETRKKYGCVFNTPHILHVSFAVGIFTMNQQWKFTRQEDTVCSSASSKCTSLQSFKQILLIFISPPVSLFI